MHQPVVSISNRERVGPGNARIVEPEFYSKASEVEAFSDNCPAARGFWSWNQSMECVTSGVWDPWEKVQRFVNWRGERDGKRSLMSEEEKV